MYTTFQKQAIQRKKKHNTILNIGKVLLIASLFLLLFTNTPSIKIESVPKKLQTVDTKSVLGAYSDYRLEKRIHAYLERMTTQEKIGQLFIISFPGSYLSDELNSLEKNYALGGVVIMSGNIISQTQLTQLSIDLQQNSPYGLIIATDQEGGTVARIPWDSARGISQQHIGIVDREDFAYQVAKTHAEALKDVHISMNFAPVLDIANDAQSPIISRSFGSDIDKVARLGKETIKAYHDEDILVVAKHFPGIGRTSTDSHYELPQIIIDKETLQNDELMPFKMAIRQDVEAIMVGHVLYPLIDADNPASLSRVFIQDILRGELGFEGLIITDDIRMDALNGYEHRALRAFQAGVDSILVADSYEAAASHMNDLLVAVDSGDISMERVEESVKRILKLKLEYGIIE